MKLSRSYRLGRAFFYNHFALADLCVMALAGWAGTNVYQSHGLLLGVVTATVVLFVIGVIVSVLEDIFVRRFSIEAQQDLLDKLDRIREDKS